MSLIMIYKISVGEFERGGYGPLDKIERAFTAQRGIVKYFALQNVK